MARALVGGLLRRGWAAGRIRVADPSADARDHLRDSFHGIHVLDDNLAAATGAETWVLAVKPQQMKAVATSLAPLAQEAGPLVISIAAGIRSGDLHAWLGSAASVIRCMPNRPAVIGAGITAIHGGPGLGAGLRRRAADVLSAAGECVWVEDESLLDAVTAVSGSGPAYVARKLAIETVFGAARLARESGERPEVLRDQVTSPGGTTAAALGVLEGAGIRDTFARAVHAATLRSRQLAGGTGK
ncbi:MAG: pyrroline-5-carboxylate reductase [Proteobacteria bacterium]|nr:pyrroline-5-carboxylate reductase [Pseudomonadota bacterium]